MKPKYFFLLTNNISEWADVCMYADHVRSILVGASIEEQLNRGQVTSLGGDHEGGLFKLRQTDRRITMR